MLLLLSLLVNFSHAEIRIMSSVPPAIKKELQADLKELHQLKFSSASPFYTAHFGTLHPYDFLQARVRRIEFDQFRCGAVGVACANEYGAFSTVTLSPRYRDGTFPQVMRVAVLLHESRHTEKGGSHHAICPTPFLDKNGRELLSYLTGERLAGRPGCDTDEFGAYGTQAAFFENVIEFCRNCTEKVKADAAYYLEDVRNRILSYRNF